MIHKRLITFIVYVSLFVVFLKHMIPIRTEQLASQEPSPAETAVENPAVAYHRCNLESIPYVSGMLETAQYLAFTNKSWIRVSDGEIELIMNHSMEWQTASDDLSNALMNAFNTENPDVIIGIPNLFTGVLSMNKPHTDYWRDNDQYRKWYLTHTRRGYQYLDALATSVYIQNLHSDCALVAETYHYFRQIWKDKDVIIVRGKNGQKYSFDVFDTAASQKIIFAPGHEAWSEYSTLKRLLLKEPPDKLYLLLIGPVATILANDLAATGRRALDLGHLAKDYDYYCQHLNEGSFFIDYLKPQEQ